MTIITETFMRNIENFPRELNPTSFKLWRNLCIMAAGIEVSEMMTMGAAEKYDAMYSAYIRIVDILTNDLNPFYEPNAALVMPTGLTRMHLEVKTFFGLSDREQVRRIKTSPEPVNGDWLWNSGWNLLKRECGNDCLEIFNEICPGGKLRSGTNVKSVIFELRCRLYKISKVEKVVVDLLSTADSIEETTASPNKRKSNETIVLESEQEDLADKYVDEETENLLNSEGNNTETNVTVTSPPPSALEKQNTPPPRTYFPLYWLGFVRYGPLAGSETNLRFVTDISEHSVAATSSTNRATIRKAAVSQKTLKNESSAGLQGTEKSIIAKATGEEALDRAAINSYTLELHVMNEIESKDRLFHRAEVKLAMLKELAVLSALTPTTEVHKINLQNVLVQTEKLAKWCD